MLPVTARNDKPNHRMDDLVSIGDFTVRRALLVECSDLPNLLRRQLPVNFVASSLPVLGNLVGHVGAFRSKEKMGRPNARRIIATMQHASVFGDGSARYLPCHTVRLLDTRSTARFLTESIAIFPASTCPQPALFTFADLRPKARNKLRFSPCVKTALGAKQSLAIMSGNESCAASEALTHCKSVLQSSSEGS